MNTRCPPKRVPSAARFFTLRRLTVQPPQSYSIGGQRSSGQLTGKTAGAWPDYRGRWCAVETALNENEGAENLQDEIRIAGLVCTAKMSTRKKLKAFVLLFLEQLDNDMSEALDEALWTATTNLLSLKTTHKEKGWREEARTEFIRVVGNKVVEMRVFGDDGDSLLVDLKKSAMDKMASDMPISLREYLVFLELARFYSPLSGAVVTMSNNQRPVQYCLPVYPEMNVDFNAVVSHVASPSEFYIQHADNVEFLILMAKIQDFYCKGEDGLEMYCPYQDQACVALFEDDVWYRARIIGTYSTNPSLYWFGIRSPKLTYLSPGDSSFFRQPRLGNAFTSTILGMEGLQSSLDAEYLNSKPEEVEWKEKINCAVLANGIWQRGEICSILPENTVEVLCYDFGKKVVVGISKLRNLKEELIYGGLALECCLSDISPADGTRNCT
ncbi:UNVERIFIED_CONTAM: hypothetical protein FKN15_077631 [Acipenser sinensis]